MALVNPKKIKLGDVLIQSRCITEEQLQEALKKQKESGDKMGDILIKQGFIDEINLAKALSDEVSAYYEREVDYQIKRLSDSIESILIVLLGAIILIVALGVYLPMWDLSKAAFGKT